MTKLFGIPMDSLVVVLVVALGAALGSVAILALRNRVFLRLGVRNVNRRRARSALIVLGLMLGTTIIAAALATGDTMSTTIRSSATASLGHADERISVRGAEVDFTVESGAATGLGVAVLGHFGCGSAAKFPCTSIQSLPCFTYTRVDFARVGSFLPSLSCVTPT